jgi:hypothetical protein
MTIPCCFSFKFVNCNFIIIIVAVQRSKVTILRCTRSKIKEKLCGMKRRGQGREYTEGRSLKAESASEQNSHLFDHPPPEVGVEGAPIRDCSANSDSLISGIFFR